MQIAGSLGYDTATFLEKGRRGRQEDAIALDFSEEPDVGILVVGDGMGGHTSGEVASHLAVSEVYRYLKQLSIDPNILENCIGNVLHDATARANLSVGDYTFKEPETRGMGTTLLVSVVVNDNLYWLSVGDSPLYIFRDNNLTRLNENHTFYNRLEQFASDEDLPSESLIEKYADCLTSAIVGSDIPQIDCPEIPIGLMEHDIIIAASDGLQYLDDDEICDILMHGKHDSAELIGKTLMSHIDALNDPGQDNIAYGIIKVGRTSKETFTESFPVKSPARMANIEHPSSLVAMLTRSKEKIRCKVSLKIQY